VEAERFLGKNIKDVVPSNLANKTLEMVEKALDTGKIQHYEYQLPFENGTRDFEARYSASGENEVIAIIRDIPLIKKRKENYGKANNDTKLNHGFSSGDFSCRYQWKYHLCQPYLVPNFRNIGGRSVGFWLAQSSSPG
jgi:hypothetical protein